MTDTTQDNSTEDTTAYFILPDGSAVHVDDWVERENPRGDYWFYAFNADETRLLNYYLNDATDKEINNLLHVLVLGTGQDNDFQHALYCILIEVL
jgi:hypothetical protein